MSCIAGQVTVGQVTVSQVTADCLPATERVALPPGADVVDASSPKGNSVKIG